MTTIEQGTDDSILVVILIIIFFQELFNGYFIMERINNIGDGGGVRSPRTTVT